MSNEIAIGIAVGCVTILLQTFVLLIAWFLRRTIEGIQKDLLSYSKNFHYIESDLSSSFYRITELEKAHNKHFPKDSLQVGHVFPKITTKDRL